VPEAVESASAAKASCGISSSRSERSSSFTAVASRPGGASRHIRSMISGSGIDNLAMSGR